MCIIYWQWSCLSLLSPLQLMIDITVLTLIGSDSPSLSDSSHVNRLISQVRCGDWQLAHSHKIAVRKCEICSSRKARVLTTLAVSSLYQVTFVQHSVRSLCGGINHFLWFVDIKASPEGHLCSSHCLALWHNMAHCSACVHMCRLSVGQTLFQCWA